MVIFGKAPPLQNNQRNSVDVSNFLIKSCEGITPNVITYKGFRLAQKKQNNYKCLKNLFFTFIT